VTATVAGKTQVSADIVRLFVGKIFGRIPQKLNTSRVNLLCLTSLIFASFFLIFTASLSV
jgi:hypothetical protein